MPAPHPTLVSLLLDGEQGLTIDAAAGESAIEHGVAPLVADLLDSGAAISDGATAARLAAVSISLEHRFRRLSESLELFAEICSDESVDFTLIKGAATRSQWFSSPEHRPIADIDVWLDPLDTHAAVRLAARIDQRVEPTARRAAEHNLPFDHYLEVGAQPIDVHTNPLKSATMLRRPDVMWSRRRPFGGRQVLDLECSIVIALVHGLRDNFADLLHLVEIGHMLAAGPDLDTIQEIAYAESATAVLDHAFCTASILLGRSGTHPFGSTAEQRRVIARIWPLDIMLKGSSSTQRALRRQALIGLFIGDRRTAAKSTAARLLPPRSLIDSEGRVPGSYPVALLRWRRFQRNKTTPQAPPRDVG